MTAAILAARTVSAFPLSIGTSLAFESLSTNGGEPYDPEREIPQRVDLKNYNVFWINLSTIFRNLHGAVPTADAAQLNDRDSSDSILVELDVINDIVRQETNDVTEVIPYISNYQGIKSLNSKVLLRSSTTEKQIAYSKLHDKTLQRVVNTLYSRSSIIKVFANKIKSEKTGRQLILTHVPYDLLAYKTIPQLELIESHTGILKTRNTWYTKFYQGSKLANIPFIEIMLKFFGDSHTFKPYPMIARNTVLELAGARHWSWLTTEAKVSQDLNTLKDHYLATTIKNL